jgi:hypothetical protein
MQGSRIGKRQQQRFLIALAATGNEVAAATEAGIVRARLLELREDKEEFAAEWEQAKKTFAERLEKEAHRRAIQGIAEPLVSDGKVVRDDKGQPMLTPRFSDSLLIALLKAERPEKFQEFAGTARVTYPAWIRWLAIVLVIACSIWVIGDLTLRFGQLALPSATGGSDERGTK